MGGSSKTTTTGKSETQASPWKPAQSGLKSLASKYGSVPGKHFVPTHTQQYKDALNVAEGLAKTPDQAYGAYEKMLGQAGGDMDMASEYWRNVGQMDPTQGNPQLEAMIDKSRQQALDLANQYGMGAGQVGRGAVADWGNQVRPGGSPQHYQAAFEGMESAALAPRLQDYYQQQGRQDAAQNMLWQHGLMQPEYAAGMDQSQLADAQLGLTLGEERNRMGDVRNEARLRQLEFQRAGLQGIGGMGGVQIGNTTNTQAYRPNPWAVALGGLGSIMPMFSGGGGLMR